MRILLICGSPRKGNTEYILNQIYNSLNCEKELILLRDYNIEHCKGCLSCHKNGKCFIDDSMNELVEKMKNADLIIFGVPNYFDNVTSLFKTFIDRCNPLYTTGELKGKEVKYIFVGGGNKEGTREVMLNAVRGFNKYLGLKTISEETYQALENKSLEIQKIQIN